MNQKHYQNINNANVNVNLMVGNVIQIKSGTTRNVMWVAKIWEKFMWTKNFIFGFLENVLLKMVNN